METPRRRTRILRAIALGALCCLLFVVPSAWVVHREWPRWLAAAIGLLAFPVLPVGWHLLAERRRRRKVAEPAKPGKPPREGLNAHDRFSLRLLAVSAVFLLPLAVFDRGGAWDAVRDDGIWFVQWASESEPAPTATTANVSDRRLLEMVPANAEAAVWIDALALKRRLTDERGQKDADEAVLAAAGSERVAIVRAAAMKLTDQEVQEIEREGMFGQKVVVLRPAPDVMVVATSGWADAVRARLDGEQAPAAALIDLIASSRTADRLVVAAARPTGAVGGAIVQSATGWVTAAGEHLVVEATARTSSGDGGLRTAVRAELDRLVGLTPESCRTEAKTLAEAIQIGGTGETVTARGQLPVGSVASVLLCTLVSE